MHVDRRSMDGNTSQQSAIQTRCWTCSILSKSTKCKGGSLDLWSSQVVGMACKCSTLIGEHLQESAGIMSTT